MLLATSGFENRPSGQVPSFLSANWFLISIAYLIAYDHSLIEAALGHLATAWRSIVLALSLRSLILFSAFPFCKCAFTEQ